MDWDERKSVAARRKGGRYRVLGGPSLGNGQTMIIARGCPSAKRITRCSRAKASPIEPQW